MQKMIKVHGALFLVSVIYAANYTIAKNVMPTYLLPSGFIVIRIAIATILFWLFGLTLKKEPFHWRKDSRLLLLCAFFGVAGNQIFFFKGLNLTTPINGSVIMTMAPVIVILVAWILGRERLTQQKGIGVLIAMTGAFLLLTKDGFSLHAGTMAGDLMILLNGALYATYLVLVKPLTNTYRPITVIKWIFLFGGFMALPFGWDELTEVQWSTISSIAWLSIGYVILLSTFAVYLLNIWALQYVNSSVVGIYIYLQPLFATCIAIIFRGDVLTWQTVIYALLIMTGVFLVSRRQSPT